MNAKRKRSPKEQEAYDKIERLRATLRAAKRDRAVHQAALLTAPVGSDDAADLFSRYAFARDEVVVFEAKLKKMEDAYRDLRERGDA